VDVYLQCRVDVGWSLHIENVNKYRSRQEEAMNKERTGTHLQHRDYIEVSTDKKPMTGYHIAMKNVKHSVQAINPFPFPYPHNCTAA